MQRPSHQFFAGPGLAENADPSFAGSYSFQLGHHATHGLGGPHDLMLTEPLAQLAILRLQLLQLEGVLYRKH